MEIAKTVSLGYDWRKTLYRHQELVRSYLELQPYMQGGKAIAVAAMEQAAVSMLYPADLINAAIEELVRQKRLLPAFSSLNTLATDIRLQSQNAFFKSLYQQLNAENLQQLDELLQPKTGALHSDFNNLKQPTGRLTRDNIRRRSQKLAALQVFRPLMDHLKTLSAIKIGSYATEAHALELGDLLDMRPEKHYSLLLCFLYETQRGLRDDLATMLIKRMDKTRTQARESLEELKAQQREMREHFIDLFAQVLIMNRQSEEDAHFGKAVRSLLANAGGTEQLWEDYAANGSLSSG